MLAAVCTLALTACPAAANTIAVNTTADGFGANGVCTLRDAVQAANTNLAQGGCPAGSGYDTIAIGPGTFKLSIVPVGGDTNASGDLNLTTGMTIRGAGRDATTIDAQSIDRVIATSPSADVTISSVTITHGRAPDGPSGQTGGDGGGIRSSGALDLSDCAVVDNRAGDGADAAGGAPSGSGGSGGGIAAGFGQQTTISRCAISGNRAGDGGDGDAVAGQADPGAPGGGGGGIATGGSNFTVIDSVIADNHAGDGGRGGEGGDGTSDGFAADGGPGGTGGIGGAALLEDGPTIVRSTISGNVAGSGGAGGNGGIAGSGHNAVGGAGGSGGTAGAVYGAGMAGAEVTDVTVVGNTAGTGGEGGAGGDGSSGDGGAGGAGGSGGGTYGTDLVSSTLTGNAAGAGGPGGAGHGMGDSAGPTGVGGLGDGVDQGELTFSIVWSNGTSDCSAMTSGGHNVAPAACGLAAGSDRTVDPALSALGDNGGPGKTIVPAANGSAIDIGTACTVSSDERGVPRPLDGGCDAGAYETGIRAASTAATDVAATSATLHGTVTPTLRATSVHFEYGTTMTYDASTPTVTAAQGADATPVVAGLSGLAPSTTYHYRVVATSAEGTAAGDDQTFTTPAAPVEQPAGGGDTQQPAGGGDTPQLPPVQAPAQTGTGGAGSTPPVIKGIAFIMDTGAVVAKLSKRTLKFTLPGVRTFCPRDAGASCNAKIIVVQTGKKKTLASLTVKVKPGAEPRISLKASKTLAKLVKAHPFVRLTAHVTVAIPGTTAATIDKQFILTR